MATRLIGTDSADPRLPAGVAVAASQTEVEDTGGLFVGTDVETVLGELQGNIISHAQGIVIDDEEPAMTDVLWADTTVSGIEAGSTVNVFVYTDEVDDRPNASVVFWIPDPWDLPNPFAALPGDCVLRSTPNVIAGLNGLAGLWKGTATEYDAIATPSADTVYFVLEDPLP